MQGNNNRFWGLEPSNTSNNGFIIYICIYISYTTMYWLYLHMMHCICIVFRHIRNIQTYTDPHMIYIYIHIQIAAFRAFPWHISIHHLYQVSNLPNLISRGTKNRSHWRRWPQTSCCTLMWGAEGVKFLWWVWFFELRIRKVEVSKNPKEGGRGVVIEIIFPWFLIEVQVFPQLFVSSKRSFSWLKGCLNNNFAKPFSTNFFPEKNKTTQPMIQGFISRLADVEARQDEEVFHCPSDECEAKCTEVRVDFLHTVLSRFS